MTRPMTEQQKWDRRISIDPETGCHNWLRYLNVNGYGQTRIGGRKGKNILAHRLAWFRAYGPTTMDVLHKCDNPRCVNIEHLFLGTQAINIKDMCAKGRRRSDDCLPRDAAHHRVMAKLKPDDVRKIRRENRMYKEIAKDYGVHPSTISNIKRGVSFAHITD